MKTPAIKVKMKISNRKTPEEAHAMEVPKMIGTIAAVRNGALISATQIRNLDGFSRDSESIDFMGFTRLWHKNFK